MKIVQQQIVVQYQNSVTWKSATLTQCKSSIKIEQH